MPTDLTPERRAELLSWVRSNPVAVTLVPTELRALLDGYDPDAALTRRALERASALVDTLTTDRDGLRAQLADAQRPHKCGDCGATLSWKFNGGNSGWFVTESGREIDALRAELARVMAERDAAGLCLSCGRIGTDWRLREDPTGTGERESACLECGSDEVRDFRDGVKVLAVRSAQLEAADTERTDAAFRMEAATARADALARKLADEHEERLRAEDAARVERKTASAERQFREDAEARADALARLLREWRETPFFERPDDWQHWVDDFGARVDAVLALSGAEIASTNATADRQMAEACERIAREHHTDHCIARQAWGDGECECGGGALARELDVSRARQMEEATRADALARRVEGLEAALRGVARLDGHAASCNRVVLSDFYVSRGHHGHYVYESVPQGTDYRHNDCPCTCGLTATIDDALAAPSGEGKATPPHCDAAPACRCGAPAVHLDVQAANRDERCCGKADCCFAGSFGWTTAPLAKEPADGE